MDRKERRQQMKTDFRSLFRGAQTEIKELTSEAARHAEQVVAGAKEKLGEINANPSVKHAKRRAKRTLAKLGASLISKFGSAAEKRAVEEAKRKKSRKPPATPPAATPPDDPYSFPPEA